MNVPQRYSCLELRQKTQPPYEVLIRFSKKDAVKVEICISEIGLTGAGYYEIFALEDLLKIKTISLPPEGQAWDLDSKVGKYPLNSARIFQ
jgi:hypothetical protein